MTNPWVNKLKNDINQTLWTANQQTWDLALPWQFVNQTAVSWANQSKSS